MADDPNNPPQVNMGPPNMASLPNAGPTAQDVLQNLPRLAQQSQQPDQASQGLDAADQFWQQQLKDNTPQPATGGPVRRLLQNFFSGMGNSMMHEGGLQTPYDKQQQAVTGLQGVANAKGMLALHNQMAAANQMVPLVNLDGSVVKGPDGTPITLPAMHATPWYAAQATAAGKVDAAEVGIHKPITVQGVGAFNWDDQQGKYVPVQGGQIPQHQLAPGEAQKLGFPAGLTQIPESLYATATRLAGTSSTRTQWLPDGAGGFIQVTNQSSRKFNGPTGSPQASPSAAGTPQAAAPSSGSSASSPKYIPGNGPIYAVDPKTQETVMTTPAEAKENGYTNPRKVTQANIEADRQLNNRLYDVAAKMQRYEQAIDTPITDQDRVKLADLLGTDKLQFGAFGAHLPTDWLTKLTQAASVARLSPAAQERLINYYNVREAMTGYTRVLTGSGRSNETNLQLNLQAMPDPIYPDNVTKLGINQFKQNIRIAGQGLPKMPGIQRAQDILEPHSAPSTGSHFLGGTANGLPDGTTGNGGRFIVKGGVWVAKP